MKNVRITDEGILRWSAFSGASEYFVAAGNQGIYVRGTSWDIRAFCADRGIAYGQLEVIIHAVDANVRQISSTWRGTYNYAAPSPEPDPDPDPDPQPQPVATVNMYRLYNPNSGEHFYTANIGERNHLIGLGWNDEGIGWVAPRTSNTPVYRLYNQYGGEHHYTTSLGERNMLINAGWNDEGIGWYSDDSRSLPLYRQYNPNAYANNHNYTRSQSENNWLVSLGWRAEGISWYGVG